MNEYSDVSNSRIPTCPRCQKPEAYVTVLRRDPLWSESLTGTRQRIAVAVNCIVEVRYPCCGITRQEQVQWGLDQTFPNRFHVV